MNKVLFFNIEKQCLSPYFMYMGAFFPPVSMFVKHMHVVPMGAKIVSETEIARFFP